MLYMSDAMSVPEYRVKVLKSFESYYNSDRICIFTHSKCLQLWKM